MTRLKKIFIRIGKWFKENITRKSFLICLLIAEAIFWSPCIVTCVLAIVISPWYWTIFTAIIVFWTGPFTPAVPLQLAFALVIEKIYFIIWRKYNGRN